MDVELAFEEREHYLFVGGQGPSDMDTMRRVLALIRDRAQLAGLTRILIDAHRVEPPRSGLHRFQMGELIAELFGARYRLAVLSPARVINKFAENTAVNRGAIILVTDDENEALGWLLRDLPEAKATAQKGVIHVK